MAYGAFRSIWITLRAQNYTAQAFESLRKALAATGEEERKFMRQTRRYMGAVGMMLVAMGLTAVSVIMGIVQKSRYGAKMIARFSKRIDKALGKLGDRLARALEPILNLIVTAIEAITALPFGEWLIIAGTAALFLVGGLLAAAMALTMINENLPLTIANLKNLIPWILKTTKAYWAQATAFIAAHPYAVGFVLGAVGTVTALAVHEAGVFQMGTSFVRKGGLAVVHTGEEIKSARERKVPSLLERKGPTKKIYNVRFDVGHLHTKADKEEIIDVVREAFRKVT